MENPYRPPTADLQSLPDRTRHGWVAVLLALLNPALSMLYVGKPLRAVAYFALHYVPLAVAVLLAHHGWWPAGLSWLPLAFVIPLVAAVDGYRTAKLHGIGFDGPWFTTWKGLAAVFVVLAGAALGFEPVRRARDCARLTPCLAGAI